MVLLVPGSGVCLWGGAHFNILGKPNWGTTGHTPTRSWWWAASLYAKYCCCVCVHKPRQLVSGAAGAARRGSSAAAARLGPLGGSSAASASAGAARQRSAGAGQRHQQQPRLGGSSAAAAEPGLLGGSEKKCKDSPVIAAPVTRKRFRSTVPGSSYAPVSLLALSVAGRRVWWAAGGIGHTQERTQEQKTERETRNTGTKAHRNCTCRSS